MSKYQDEFGNITEVGSPELNPNLIAGKTLVSDAEPIGVINPNFSGVTTDGGYANTKINSATLAPSNSYDFGTPSNYGVTAFPPQLQSSQPSQDEYALGKTETGISEMIKSLTSDTLGAEKEAYRIEQEKATGLEALKSAENDYIQQYKQLEAEYKNIEPRVTEESIGLRGMKGIQTITESEQRKVLMKANTVSALLSAAQGNVAFAQSQIDRAVANKFAVREAERKTKLENLQLLSQDPSLTIEQKKRADATARRLKLEEQTDLKKKEDTKTILDWATKASAAGATPEKAREIADIALSENPDIRRAIELYAPYSVPKGTPPTSVQEYEYAVKGGYKGSFTDYQNEDANRKKSIAAAGVAGDNGLTAKETQNFLSITTKFQADPFINNALKGKTAVAIADQVIADPSNAANQLKSLYVLVKNLDPDSAVREGEISLAEKTQSYLQTWAAKFTKISEGQVVAPATAKLLAEATKELAQAWFDTATRRENQYKAQATGVGERVGEAFNQYLQTSNLTYNGISLPSSEGGSSYNGITLPN